MTGRTHDLAAFTTVNYLLISSPLLHMSLATLFVSFTATLVGGLTPDIDQPTGDLWRKLPGGTIYSRIFTPFLGGHRHISHSLLGIVLFGFLSKYLLQLISHTLLVNMTIVWWAFMISYVSHLIMDTFTKEGVPWLFPIPIKFGFPPLALFRIKTGGLIEKYVIFPFLIVLNGVIIYNNYSKFLLFFHQYIH